MRGPPGNNGDMGPTVPQGLTGTQGLTGPAGPTGPQGIEHEAIVTGNSNIVTVS